MDDEFAEVLETQDQAETQTEEPVAQVSDTAQVEESLSQILEKMDGMLYSEDLGLILQDLDVMNSHLEDLKVCQQNAQNIQVPMLCGVSLCFGGILALILSNYLRH